MKQMNVPEDIKVSIDFDDESLPANVRELQPMVYQAESGGFHCLLGPDTTTGIFSHGETPDKALENWNAALSERMRTGDKNDEVSLYVRDVLNTSEDDVW